MPRSRRSEGSYNVRIGGNGLGPGRPHDNFGVGCKSQEKSPHAPSRL
jgi:hypothetical protein